MKYAIVTGASPSSIGFLAAKKLASPKFNFKVILACRDESKGNDALQRIRSEFPSCQAAYIHLDLASFASIHKFVDNIHALDDGAILKEDIGLSLLVNNAGVGFGKETPYIETTDGLEEIVGVNHFGTFLLTQLLLDDIKRADKGRISIVSSSLHDANGRSMKKSSKDAESEGSEGDSGKKLILPNFPDGLLQSEDNYDGFKAYQTSKLCNLWYTYELQRRLEDSNVKVNAISPGFIPSTGLTRRSGVMGDFFLKYILDPWRYLGLGITRSPEDGAEVIVQVSTSDVASKGGQYFQLPKGSDTIEAVPSSEESMDVEKAKQLWDISLKTCKL